MSLCSVCMGLEGITRRGEFLCSWTTEYSEYIYRPCPPTPGTIHGRERRKAPCRLWKVRKQRQSPPPLGHAPSLSGVFEIKRFTEAFYKSAAVRQHPSRETAWVEKASVSWPT